MRVLFLVIVLIVLFLIGIASGVSPDKVKEVREKHEAKLFEEEGVSAVSDDEVTGEIVVYVEKEEHIKKIPKKLEDVPVRVEVIGRIEALKSAVAAGRPKATTRYNRLSAIRPIFGGISVGNAEFPTSAGTLGIVATLGSVPVILSNTHVLAMGTDGNFVPLGTEICQPGGYDDGSQCANIVGELIGYVPITFGLTGVNYADAAIASVTVGSQDGDVLNEKNNGFYHIVGGASVVPGYTIKKSGRTSGVTSGKVLSASTSARVYYSQTTYAMFYDQIMATAMSQAGDSGSVVWYSSNEKNYFVGLLFAGSNQVTIICKERYVKEKLGILLN